MSPMAIGWIIFALVFSSALLAMLARRLLPEQHLSPNSKDVVKLGIALIATMSALVLSLLIASAKTAFDTRSNQLVETSSDIILLDRALARYGPETKEARSVLQRSIAAAVERFWPAEGARRRQLIPYVPDRNPVRQARGVIATERPSARTAEPGPDTGRRCGASASAAVRTLAYRSRCRSSSYWSFGYASSSPALGSSPRAMQPSSPSSASARCRLPVRSLDPGARPIVRGTAARSPTRRCARRWPSSADRIWLPKCIVGRAMSELAPPRRNAGLGLTRTAAGATLGDRDESGSKPPGVQRGQSMSNVAEQRAAIPRATARRSRRISVIWIIPLVAVAIGGWLAWDTLSKEGPTITISFDSGEGLQAGQSQLKFKDIVFGTVKSLELAPDHTHVIVTVATTRQAKPLADRQDDLLGGQAAAVRRQRLRSRDAALRELISACCRCQAGGKAQREFVGQRGSADPAANVPGPHLSC